MTDLRVVASPATTAVIDEARANLSGFVLDQAEKIAKREGLRWRACELAPSTFEQVLKEYRSCQASGLPYRVNPLYCDNIIFTRPEVNHAMRFWHDMQHVRQHMSFRAEDEMVLGVHHLQVLRGAGFGPESIEFRLLHADTVGQTLCGAMFSRFPADQLGFATLAVMHGLDAALAAEAACEARELRRQLGGDAA